MGFLGKKLSKISFKYNNFSIKRNNLKMLCAKCCSDLTVFNQKACELIYLSSSVAIWATVTFDRDSNCEISAKRYSQQQVRGRSFRWPSDCLRQLMATALTRHHVTRMLQSGHVTGWSPSRWPGGCAFPGLGSGRGSPRWCGWLPQPICGTNQPPCGECRPFSQRMSVCIG